MKRLLVGALIAAAAATGTPTANAVCAHHHGHPHAHSGRCSCTPNDDASVCEGFGVSVENQVADAVVCALAAATPTGVFEC